MKAVLTLSWTLAIGEEEGRSALMVPRIGVRYCCCRCASSYLRRRSWVSLVLNPLRYLTPIKFQPHCLFYCGQTGAFLMLTVPDYPLPLNM